MWAEELPPNHYHLVPYGEDDAALVEALEHYRDGKYSQARPVLENALESLIDFEGRHSLAYILGDIALESGDPNTAERFLRQAAQYPPLMSLAHARLGTLLRARGDQEGALDALAAVRPGSPQYPDARYERARLLLQRKQLSEAFEDAEDAAMEATSDRDREKARLLLADVLVAKEEKEEWIKPLLALERAEVPLNIVYMLVTLLTFQSLRSWLNAEAPLNIDSILVTFLVLQFAKCWSKDDAA